MHVRSFSFVSILFLICSGCASNSAPKPALLSLKSVATGRGFAQKFPHAWFSQADDGDREIVLINDGYVNNAPQTGGPLKPVSAMPLEQVMHFKILWNPLPGTHTDAPSTTNAVIDWMITSARPGVAGDSLHYRGAGFVSVDGDEQRLVLSITNATLEPASHTGSLVDPLGTCLVNGRFIAYRNDGLVKATIADLQGGSSSSEASADLNSDSGGPPSRAPSAP